MTSEDASNATGEIVEDTSSEATESSEEDGGTLVVYFSATGTTKDVAEKIAGICQLMHLQSIHGARGDRAACGPTCPRDRMKDKPYIDFET